MKPRSLIVLGFLGTILAGAFLLMLSVSSPAHTWMKPFDALFTACSAVCITGLSVIDVGRDLSFFGQCVLLTLVQLGCVGIMTIGTFFLLVVGRRISLASEFSLMNAYGASGVKGFRSLVLWVVGSMLVFESLGAIVLHECFVSMAEANPSMSPDSTSWFRAFFYSAMAFCNAGFSRDPNSLAVFQSQPFVLLTMGCLIILGGVGFIVLYNLFTIQFWRRNLLKRGRLSLHTRVVLLCTAVLTLLSFIFVLAVEWNGSLDAYPLKEKLAIGFFQAVTPRTSGFTVVPLHESHAATRFFSEVMMFVGAAPGGAGGGIKVTTVAVFATTLWAICRGRRDAVLFRRTIPEVVVREAIVIVVVFGAMVALGMTTLLLTESGNEALTFENLLFETVSAVSTTGLSCGSTTSELSAAGRVVIMLCMFGGRLGALAIVMLIGGTSEEGIFIRYPREELVVG